MGPDGTDEGRATTGGGEQTRDTRPDRPPTERNEIGQEDSVNKKRLTRVRSVAGSTGRISMRRKIRCKMWRNQALPIVLVRKQCARALPGCLHALRRERDKHRHIPTWKDTLSSSSTASRSTRTPRRVRGERVSQADGDAKAAAQGGYSSASSLHSRPTWCQHRLTRSAYGGGQPRPIVGLPPAATVSAISNRLRRSSKGRRRSQSSHRTTPNEYTSTCRETR